MAGKTRTSGPIAPVAAVPAAATSAVAGGQPSPDPVAIGMERPPTRSRGSYRAWVTALAGLLLLPMAVVAILTLPVAERTQAAAAAAARVVSAATLETQYGIRINLVAVTADGGLVDLRFTVLDKTKAEHLLHDAEDMPRLFVETRAAVLAAPHPMAHKLNIVDGASYFLLYPNAGGAIQQGTQVSVVIDDIRLIAVTAQS
jgi:hypothetical protein